MVALIISLSVNGQEEGGREGGGVLEMVKTRLSRAVVNNID